MNSLPGFNLAVQKLTAYRASHVNTCYGQYGLQLVFRCLKGSQGPVTRQTIIAIGVAAGYSESTISGAICVAKRHGHLRSIKQSKQLVYYQPSTAFMKASYRIYVRSPRGSSQFYIAIP
ncbi:hypothetical protein UCCLBBS124_0066 [Levilactobacillus brevis]|nr:hypothetical protein UCCLBBS124_0066 [Levilactobacillus brevis]